MKQVLTVLSVAVVAASCGEKLPAEKPTAPDMGRLVSDYRSPSAALAEVTVQDVLEGLEERFGFLQQLGSCNDQGECGGPSVLLDTLGKAGGSEGSTQELSPGVEQRRDAIKVGNAVMEGEGFIRIHHVCEGLAATVDEASNGKLTLTAGFSDAGLDPVIWGEFAACVLPGVPSQYLDGLVSMYIGSNLQFDNLVQSPTLFQFAGFRFAADALEDAGFDFRISAEGGFELRVPLPAGLHVLFYIREGQFGFAALDGDWGCELSLDSIRAGGLCTKAGEEVVW